MPELLGQLEQAVMLAILRKQPSAYGVSIQGELVSRTGRKHSVGAIYSTLDRLEKKGLVETRAGEVTAQRGGRAKLYFQLTAPGEAALQASLTMISALARGTKLASALSRLSAGVFP